MRSKKKGIKKFLAEFLCVALIACGMPGAAFAAEGENTDKGSVTAGYDIDGSESTGAQKDTVGSEIKDTSGTGTKGSADSGTKDSEGTSGTDEKDSAGTNEQGKGEGTSKDSDGASGTDGESSEGKDEGYGTETKESDFEKTESESEDGGKESADTAQDTSDEADEGSDGKSTEDPAEDDLGEDAGSEDDTDMDSDDGEEDTSDKIDIEDKDESGDDSDAENDDEAGAEDKDEDESDVTDTAKGGSAASGDEEDEENEEDEEEEDWIDGLLDDDLMLLTASPSDATPVAEMDGQYYDTVQDAIDEAANRSTITMVDDSTENIVISDGLILTLDLAGFTLEGESEGSVVTIIGAELTLEDSGGDEGRITGGNSDYGGGVYISDGTFRMAGGTISDNTADIYGGGVYLDSGTFTMTGGIICENTADAAGSDIYAEEGSVAILEASDMMDGDYEWFEDGEDERYSEDDTAMVCDDEDVIGASSPGSVRGLALVASDAIMPLADGVAQIGSTTYATVQAAVNAAGSGATIKMIADSEENVSISSGKDITLDLAGFTLDGSQNGSVITNNGTLTLKDSSGNDSGRITNGKAKYGGGIYNTGILTMNGGTITENEADDGDDNRNYSEGGGVYNDAGTFIMNGGAINSNKGYYQAGGLENDNNATFIMYGGSISGNETTNGKYGHGGGIYCYNSSATIYGGEICNNSANYGGGISCGGSTSSNRGVLNIYGGTISGNSASYDGGGVHILGAGGVLNIYGGKITGNSSGDQGGGVWSCGEVLLKDCEISGNTAVRSGGGFYATDGPGVYRYIHLEGNVYIDGNYLDTGETSNFFMDSSCNYLILNEDLAEGSSIGISRENAVPDENNRVQITRAETDTEYYKTSAQYFYYDGDSTYKGVANDKEHYVDIGLPFEASLDQDGTTTYYDTVQAAIDAAGSTEGTVMMWGDSTENITITDGQNITLDLNGYTLDGNLNGSVITNYGSLTITDSGDSGCITNGNADAGGGIYNYGTLTMEGGTVSGNTAGSGGGVYNVSVFNMEGGTVSGNTADSGGGIYTSGAFSMSGGSIYGNTADTAAADIYAVSGSSLNLIAASEMEADGYTVTGWFNDSAGARYADTDNPEECDTGSAGVCYVIAAYGSTVTYSVDGDTDMIAAAFIDITKGETKVTLASADEVVVPAAYCYFDNWNTAEDGSGTTYAGGAAYSGESVTLYAQFASHDWKVSQTVIEYFEDYYEEHITLKCSRCGMEYEQTITVTTESKSGVTTDSDFSWSDIISTDELAELFEAGAELDFTLTSETIPDSDISSTDKDLVEDLIASQWSDTDYTASWVDISAQLDILYPDGTEETRTYTEALNPITITMTIPDELLNASGNSYAVIRIYDGEASVIDSVDNGDGTLTFDSDLIGNYVIVKVTDSNNSGTGSPVGTGRHSGGSSGSSGSGVSGSGSIAYTTGTWTIDEYSYWRFTDSNGRRYENEWGYIYNPYADTSAGQPSASWFHFGYDGIMDTGWYIDTNGKMYYLNPSLDNTQGAMFTGWGYIDGKWYYFDASGALLRSTQTPDGYTVDETGALVEG